MTPPVPSSTTATLRPWPRWLTVVVVLFLLAALWAAGRWWLRSLTVPEASLVLALSAVLLVVAVLRAYQARPAGSQGLGVYANVVLLGAGSAVALAWVVAGLRIRAIGSGTPAPPPGITNPMEESQRAQVLAYARGLELDSITHRAADSTYLTIVDTVRADTSISVVSGRPVVRITPLDSSQWRIRNLVGPWAKIVPVRSAYLNDVSDIGPGRGRVVARVYVDPAYQAPNGAAGYPPMLLPPGISYLWIDSLPPGGDTARVVIIPEDPQQGVRSRHVHYTHLRPVWETYSRAAWQFFREENTDPACFNVTCPYGCCDSCSRQ